MMSATYSNLWSRLACLATRSLLGSSSLQTKKSAKKKNRQKNVLGHYFMMLNACIMQQIQCTYLFAQLFSMSFPSSPACFRCKSRSLKCRNLDSLVYSAESFSHCSETIFNPNVRELTVFFHIIIFHIYMDNFIAFLKYFTEGRVKNARFVRSNG